MSPDSIRHSVRGGGGHRSVSWSFCYGFFFALCQNFHAGFSLARSMLLHVSSARLPEIVLCSGELLQEAGKQSDLSIFGTYGGARVKNGPISPSAPARCRRRGFPWSSLILQCLRLFCHAQTYVRANHITESHLSPEGVGTGAGIPSQFLLPNPPTFPPSA